MLFILVTFVKIGNMLKIGHRGAKGYIAENTLASFTKAIKMGADAIELDVHCCSTGEIVVIHDETVDRTTNGKGLVSELSLSELKILKVAKNHSISTLEEVLTSITQKCIINIELKGKNTASKTVALLEELIATNKWNYTNFIISSFDWNALLEVRYLNTNIRIGVLTNTDVEHAYAFAKYNDAYSIHPSFELLTKESTSLMQNKGFKIFAWTVNEVADIKLIKSFGVYGIISDYPDRL